MKKGEDWSLILFFFYNFSIKSKKKKTKIFKEKEIKETKKKMKNPSNSKLLQEIMLWAKKNNVQVTNDNIQDVSLKFFYSLPVEIQKEIHK